jgi:hypothetical protein
MERINEERRKKKERNERSRRRKRRFKRESADGKGTRGSEKLLFPFVVPFCVSRFFVD